MEELKAHLRQGAIDLAKTLEENVGSHDAQFLKYFGVDGIDHDDFIQQPNFGFVFGLIS